MDVSNVAAQGLSSELSPASAATPDAKPAAEASPDAVAAFRDATEATAPQTMDAAAVPADEAAWTRKPAEMTIAAPADGDAAGAAGSMTPGDAILRGMQKMSDGFTGAVDRIGEVMGAVKPGEMINAGDLLQAQLALSQVTLHQDMASKVVGKATQSLDMFLKNQ